MSCWNVCRGGDDQVNYVNYEKPQACDKTTWLLSAALIITLAIAVLGGLALLGIHNPAGVLGELGKTFGLIGSSVVGGVGLLGFSAAMITMLVRCCRDRCGGEAYVILEEDQPHFEPNQFGGGNPLHTNEYKGRVNDGLLFV